MCILGPFRTLLKMGSIDPDLQGHFRQMFTLSYLRNGLIDWHQTKNIWIERWQRRTWMVKIGSIEKVSYTHITDMHVLLIWGPRGIYIGSRCSCFVNLFSELHPHPTPNKLLFSNKPYSIWTRAARDRNIRPSPSSSALIMCIFAYLMRCNDNFRTHSRYCPNKHVDHIWNEWEQYLVIAQTVQMLTDGWTDGHRRAYTNTHQSPSS